MATLQSLAIEKKKFNDLLREIDALPMKLRKGAELSVLRAGAGLIRKSAKSFAARSKDSGALAKSIAVTITGKTGSKTARVGPLKNFKMTVTRTWPETMRTGRGDNADRTYTMEANPQRYSHLVEYGTSKTPAKPYIRPAIDATQEKVADAMAAQLDLYLTRILAKSS